MLTVLMQRGAWVVLGFIALLFLLSLTPIGEGRGFSNILVDSYPPHKALIIEKNPCRLVLLGEFSNNTTGKNQITNIKGDGIAQTHIATYDAITSILRELECGSAVPTYPMNVSTIIDLGSRISGNKNRGASKTIVFTADKEGGVQSEVISNEDGTRP